MQSPVTIFDRRVLRFHRDRAAETIAEHDFLINESAARLAEHFDGEIKQQFPLALDLGCRTGALTHMLKDKAGIKQIIQSDISAKMLSASPYARISADEELLPFAAGSFDLIVSNLTLHWVNDLPGTLIQINRSLKKDGLFLATMLGGNTLKELKQAIIAAESETSNGISPRISPFADVKDAGRLLQRANFSLPVANIDNVTVMYENTQKLFSDLKGMGESNALTKRKSSFTTKSSLDAVDEKYKELFMDENGMIPASFEIITLTGWKN